MILFLFCSGNYLIPSGTYTIITSKFFNIYSSLVFIRFFLFVAVRIYLLIEILWIWFFLYILRIAITSSCRVLCRLTSNYFSYHKTALNQKYQQFIHTHIKERLKRLIICTKSTKCGHKYPSTQQLDNLDQLGQIFLPCSFKKKNRWRSLIFRLKYFFFCISNLGAEDINENQSPDGRVIQSLFLSNQHFHLKLAEFICFISVVI